MQMTAPRDGAFLSERYPALPRSPAQARAAVVSYARSQGASQEMLARIALAVSEAVTNVVVHAYRGAPAAGIVQLTAEIAGGELLVVVSDRGSGLRAGDPTEGLGLGLAIIAQSASAVDLVRAPGGGLELRMRFVLATQA
jgi:serine/threonine-protein kinase RsbW